MYRVGGPAEIKNVEIHAKLLMVYGLSPFAFTAIFCSSDKACWASI